MQISEHSFLHILFTNNYIWEYKLSKKGGKIMDVYIREQ